MSASKSHESLTLPKHNVVSRNTTDSIIVTPTTKPEWNHTIKQGYFTMSLFPENRQLRLGLREC